MNKFIALTKIQIFDFLSKYTQHLNVKNKWLGKLALLLPALLIIPALQLVLSMYEIFDSVGFPELTITYMYIANVMMMFFAGIPFIISVFFYSKDLPFLTSLPLKEDTIVFSKLASVYIYLLAIGCFFFGTSVIIYGVKGGLQLYSLTAGLIALLISPLIPMILSTLLIIPFMSIIGRGKRRNLMVMAGNIILVVAIIFIQLSIAKVQIDPEAFSSILLQEDGLLMLIGRSFPPSIWLTQMIKGSLISGVLFILLNIALIYSLKLVSHLLYRNGLLAFNQEGGGFNEKGKIYYKKRSKGIQIIKRHILIIFSNPVFTLNTVMTMIIPILVFIIMLFTGEVNTGLFQSPMLAPYVVFIYTAVIATPAIVGSISATVITREGKTFWETKVLPITTADNIKYRVYSTFILSFGGSLVLAIVGAAFLPVSPIMIIVASIFCISATLFFSTIDIAINIERPILNWTNPTTAVKNNLNIMISLLIRLLTGGVLYLLYMLINNLSANVILIIFSFILVSLYGVSYYVVLNKYINKFNNIVC
ncbi:ABC transporter permease [Alkaliphilus peptidifermentans]|uniref:ABC-2 type transport system permease protein n=1 Tax=Alkaliphilus peptidifermentans DSM 18978 TaxID=1120976 RepID=A0A1G5JSN5_9FIRM|nr:hypothetical protein [Alkaliphilus peptidifermentans]SCY91346.1 ABC-2 type transport system permease protein [Alkaliphilus peptidifermentans DSM 18978]